MPVLGFSDHGGVTAALLRQAVGGALGATARNLVRMLDKLETRQAGRSPVHADGQAR
jgi:hypothetical protein